MSTGGEKGACSIGGEEILATYLRKHKTEQESKRARVEGKIQFKIQRVCTTAHISKTLELE